MDVTSSAGQQGITSYPTRDELREIAGLPELGPELPNVALAQIELLFLVSDASETAE